MSLNLIGDERYIWFVCNQSFEITRIFCLPQDVIMCTIRFTDMVHVKSVLCSSNICLGRLVGINESKEFCNHEGKPKLYNW